MDERLQFVASWRAEDGTLQRVGVRRSNDSSCGRGEDSGAHARATPVDSARYSRANCADRSGAAGDARA